MMSSVASRVPLGVAGRPVRCTTEHRGPMARPVTSPSPTALDDAPGRLRLRGAPSRRRRAATGSRCGRGGARRAARGHLPRKRNRSWSRHGDVDEQDRGLRARRPRSSRRHGDGGPGARRPRGERRPRGRGASAGRARSHGRDDAEAESALEAARVAASAAKTTHERFAKLLGRSRDRQAAVRRRRDALPFRCRAGADRRARGFAPSRRASTKRGRASPRARPTLGYARIVAPFGGRVLERRVDPGALASPGMPLFVVADEGMLRVEAAVEESHASDVKIGDDGSIDIEGPPGSSAR